MSWTDVDWSEMDFDDKKKAEAGKPASSCPKCGRPLGKGGHFHVKACKGVTDDADPR